MATMYACSTEIHHVYVSGVHKAADDHPISSLFLFVPPPNSTVVILNLQREAVSRPNTATIRDAIGRPLQRSDARFSRGLTLPHVPLRREVRVGW